MRKIKSKLEKNFKKKAKKTKLSKINDDKELEKAYFVIGLKYITDLAQNLFNFRLKLTKLKYDKINSLKFRNNVNTEDSLTKEFSLIKTFIKMYHKSYGATEEQLLKRISYIKNKKVILDFELQSELKFRILKSTIEHYLNDVESEHMISNNEKYLKLLASVLFFKESLDKLTIKDLSDMYNRTNVHVAKRTTTRLCNKIPHSLAELTGNDFETEKNFTTLLKLRLPQDKPKKIKKLSFKKRHQKIAENV